MDKIKFWVTFFLFLASPSLYALTTLHVSSSTDNNPGGRGDPGDLRFCLNSMNEDLQTIPDDYAIVFDFPMTIQLNGILPIINSSANPVNITIGNPGSIATVTIDGNAGAYSGFFIPMGNVTIQNINFKEMTAKGGNGGDGISGGGGGLGAGGAIYVPQNFLYGSNPSVTLMNVSITNCSAVGGNGDNYLTISSPTGSEGGGGGGFSGNGGSITTTGVTGGAGGGGFGGNGGDVTQSTSGIDGGGGGGGGGIGSRATLGILTNLGNGGSDQDIGQNGNGFGLSITAGAGGGGKSGGIFAGGGGGGRDVLNPGGGGGGSAGSDGLSPQGSTPAWAPTVRKSPTLMGGLIRQSVNQPSGKSVTQIVDEMNVLFSKYNGKNVPFNKTLPPAKPQVNQKLLALHAQALFASATPSGGDGGPGGGAGGGGVVKNGIPNNTDGHSGNGGYAGGGGGGAGIGSSDTDYTVIGGDGGIGGGGGGGGVNQSGSTSANGGNSQGGGGGGGGGPSNGSTASGGSDVGNLGGGSGGSGDSTVGVGFGGGGGGGGSGLGGAIFIDSGLNFTIQALSGIPTVFNTTNNTTQSGHHGNGATSASDGLDGTALGNSIFLRRNSSLSLVAQQAPWKSNWLRMRLRDNILYSHPRIWLAHLIRLM